MRDLAGNLATYAADFAFTLGATLDALASRLLEPQSPVTAEPSASG